MHEPSRPKMHSQKKHHKAHIRLYGDMRFRLTRSINGS